LSGHVHLGVDGALGVSDEADPGEVVVDPGDGANDAAGPRENDHPFVQAVVEAAVDGDCTLEARRLLGDDIGSEESVFRVALLVAESVLEFPDAQGGVLLGCDLVLECLDLVTQSVVVTLDATAIGEAEECVIDGAGEITQATL